MLVFVSSVLLHVYLAQANFDQDCTQLGAKYKIADADKAAFKSACVKFEDGCYKIEDKAAEACGATGTAGREADAASSAATAAIGKGSGSFVASGSIANQNCATLKRLRAQQLDGCRKLSQSCFDTKSEFAGKTSKASLTCPTFGPENDKWSPGARKAASMCRAIQNEVMTVEMKKAVEEEQCKGIDASVKSATQSPGENDVAKPKPKTKPSWMESHPYDGPSNPARIEIAYPDARACGIFGCEKNENGTYTPIRK